jgi:hypothetical protein
VYVENFLELEDGSLRTPIVLYYENVYICGYVYLPKEGENYFQCVSKDKFFDDYGNEIFEKIILDAVKKKFDEVMLNFD